VTRNIITDDGRRYDLDKAEDLGLSTREERGVKITGVYKTKRGTVVVGTYSIWERGHSGECVGQSYHVAGGAEIASLARQFDCDDLVNMVPLAE